MQEQGPQPRPKTDDRILEYLRGLPPDESPTVRDIQAALGISSTSVVDYNLDKLVKRGEITRELMRARGIRLVRRPAIEVRIDLPWVAEEILRGNSRAHWAPKAAAVSEQLERGIEYGLVAKTDHPYIDFPIRGLLSVEITVWNTRPLDWENVAIGYKGFLDGLQEVWKRDKYGDAPGAGVVVDDVQFVDGVVRTRVGTPRTRIVIRRAE